MYLNKIRSAPRLFYNPDDCVFYRSSKRIITNVKGAKKSSQKGIRTGPIFMAKITKNGAERA